MAIPWQLRIVILMNRKTGLNLITQAATESVVNVEEIPRRLIRSRQIGYLFFSGMTFCKKRFLLDCMVFFCHSFSFYNSE